MADNQEKIEMKCGCRGFLNTYFKSLFNPLKENG